MAKVIYFYPRSPCGERRQIRTVNNYSNSFLPTLSMRRATPYYIMRTEWVEKFLPTLSMRRATSGSCLLSHSDIFLPTLSMRRATTGNLPAFCGSTFLPTLSMRRATAKDNKNTYKIYSQFVKTQNHCGLCPLILPHTAFK